jgi:3-oxoadipate CoA-transferase beta subunit
MDLAIGAKQVWVLMTLFARDGSPKLVPTCSYPLTGVRCVSRVYTDVATFELPADPGRPIGVRELHSVTFADLAARLDLPLRRAD